MQPTHAWACEFRTICRALSLLSDANSKHAACISKDLWLFFALHAWQVCPIFECLNCLVFPGTWRVVQACGLHSHPVDVVPQPVVIGKLARVYWHAVVCACVHAWQLWYGFMQPLFKLSALPCCGFVLTAGWVPGTLFKLGCSNMQHAYMHASAQQGDGRNIFDYSGGSSYILYPWCIHAAYIVVVFCDMGGWFRGRPFHTDSHPKTTNRCCLGLRTR